MKEGWEYKKLGEVTSTINGLWTGKKPPFINVAVVRNTNFTKDCKLDMTNVAYLDVEEKQFSTRKLQYGDIIIEKSGGSEKQPVGRPVLFNIKEGNYSFSNFTSTLRINNKSELEPHFLHYSLVGAYFRGATSKMQAKTTGIHNLDFKAYLRLLIPIPTIEEQQQIVSELDLLSGIIEKQKAQLEELDKLAQSIFHDMFGDPCNNHKNFEVKPIEKVCILKAGKAIKAEELLDYSENLYPCYGGNGIRGYINRFSHDGTFPIIGRQGALCGNVNLANGQFYATEHAVVVTPIIDLNAIWLYYVLLNMRLGQYAHGVAQPGLSVKDISPLLMILPPLSLQQEFAAKVEAIEAMKTKVRQSLKEAETLFNERMDYYFN